MKPKLILCLALVLSGGLFGCETENIQKSDGHAVNLNGDKRADMIQMQIAGGGRLKNGNPFAFYSLNTNSLLVITYPTNNLNQMLQSETGSHQVYAWLVRNQSQDWQQMMRLEKEIASADSLPNLSISNAEQLHGHVETEQADWRHKNLAHVGFDLTGDDGTTLKGEFNSYDKTKFDAKQLWLDPYIIIFGPFVKW
jgi:hypothetical protein